MKERGILHPRLAQIVASMGHGEVLGIADAGLPIPAAVERVDLAYAPGRASWASVVQAVLTELRVEEVVVAEESREHCPELVQSLLGQVPDAAVLWVDHTELKRRSARARAIVRTGQFTPYANALLTSGVDFG